MKNIICLLLTVLLLVQLGSVSLASYVYEDEDGNFTIELPDDFDEVESMKFIGDDGSNIGVSVSEYSEDDEDYCIADMSEDELRERAQTMADVSYVAFASLNRDGSIEVVSVEKIQHPNGLEAVEMVFRTSAAAEDGESVRYQKVYEFTCANHIYTFTYTSCDGGSADALDESFDSIEINEVENSGIKGKVTGVIAPLVVFGIVGLGIVRFIRTPEKRKKGKL